MQFLPSRNSLDSRLKVKRQNRADAKIPSQDSERGCCPRPETMGADQGGVGPCVIAWEENAE